MYHYDVIGVLGWGLGECRLLAGRSLCGIMSPIFTLREVQSGIGCINLFFNTLETVDSSESTEF